MINGVSEVEAVGRIVCNSCSASSVVKGSATGEHCSVVCFGRENNLSRRGSCVRLQPCRKQNNTLCNNVNTNAIYVSQSLRVVVVLAVCRCEISCFNKARRFVS